MPDADLLALFFCAKCVDEHGSNPQSVSCYCDCHNSTRDVARWPTVREAVIVALGGQPSPEWCPGGCGYRVEDCMCDDQ